MWPLFVLNRTAKVRIVLSCCAAWATTKAGDVECMVQHHIDDELDL